ncbi:MAG: hypothetical protein A2Y07_04845 [Planctomycetes bacterium GWF2_50_10]|nr:MAG: hypothetical protein A2Y07_04845 [Planctomycetes bacterium GWF2_50_10]
MMRSNEKQSAKQFEAMGAMGSNRNKTVIAIVLVSIMGLMWARVLLQKKPATARAETAVLKENATKQDSSKSCAIKYMILPRVEGRHDVIGRDLFCSRSWNNNEAKTNTGGNSIKEQGDVVVEKIQINVKLEAISSGASPKAFINGMLLEKGGRLVVKADGSKYEVDVKSITDGAVVLAVNGVEFTVAMSKAVETTD